jgi:nicotinate-nucleotide adenylyltransferase
LGPGHTLWIAVRRPHGVHFVVHAAYGELVVPKCARPGNTGGGSVQPVSRSQGLGVTSAAPQARRIGVFGGAFDPPHIAHVALAKAAIKELQLDELRVFPTGQAWHKPQSLSPTQHRLAMTALAFHDVPKVVIDSREVLREGPTFTVDTLHELKSEWPQAELFLIVGEDQALALPSWHEWQEILRLAIICVAEREDSTGSKTRFTAPQAYESRFKRLHTPAMTVSATDIRSRIASHHCVASLVFEPVARYIDDHHLYQTT